MKDASEANDGNKVSSFPRVLHLRPGRHYRQERRRMRAGLLRSLDRESGETDADIPAGTVAAEGEGYVALGHCRCMRSFACAGLRGGAGVPAEHLPDVGDVGEGTVPVIDLVLADAETATLGAERDRHGLPIVTGDPAGTVGGFVDRRPTVKSEGHVAFHGSGVAVVCGQRAGSEREQADAECRCR